MLKSIDHTSQYLAILTVSHRERSPWMEETEVLLEVEGVTKRTAEHGPRQYRVNLSVESGKSTAARSQRRGQDYAGQSDRRTDSTRLAARSVIDGRDVIAGSGFRSPRLLHAAPIARPDRRPHAAPGNRIPWPAPWWKSRGRRRPTERLIEASTVGEWRDSDGGRLSGGVSASSRLHGRRRTGQDCHPRRAHQRC